MTAAAWRRTAIAVLLAVGAVASLWTGPDDGARTPDTGVVHVPCRPVVVAGRAECTGTADIPPNTRLVIYEPATSAEAAMVRRQILDARGGTP